MLSTATNYYTTQNKGQGFPLPPPRYVLGKGKAQGIATYHSLTSYRTDTANLYLSGTHRGATEIFILQSEPEHVRKSFLQ